MDTILYIDAAIFVIVIFVYKYMCEREYEYKLLKNPPGNLHKNTMNTNIPYGGEDKNIYLYLSPEYTYNPYNLVLIVTARFSKNGRIYSSIFPFRKRDTIRITPDMEKNMGPLNVYVRSDNMGQKYKITFSSKKSCSVFIAADCASDSNLFFSYLN
jgi:hypothetical protein